MRRISFMLTACAVLTGTLSAAAVEKKCKVEDSCIGVMGKPGPCGPCGPRGPCGPPGPTGPAGSTIAATSGEWNGLTDSETLSFTFDVPSGKSDQIPINTLLRTGSSATYNSLTGTFTITTAGSYMIEYGVNGAFNVAPATLNSNALVTMAHLNILRGGANLSDIGNTPLALTSTTDASSLIYLTGRGSVVLDLEVNDEISLMIWSQPFGATIGSTFVLQNTAQVAGSAARHLTPAFLAIQRLEAAPCS